MTFSDPIEAPSEKCLCGRKKDAKTDKDGFIFMVCSNCDTVQPQEGSPDRDTPGGKRKVTEWDKMYDKRMEQRQKGWYENDTIG